MLGMVVSVILVGESLTLKSESNSYIPLLVIKYSMYYDFIKNKKNKSTF